MARLGLAMTRQCHDDVIVTTGHNVYQAISLLTKTLLKDIIERLHIGVVS